jgi:alkylation response protein AidB-like acyl-CoA dehydrogenase
MKPLELSPDLQPILARFMADVSDVDAHREPSTSAPLNWTALVEEVGVVGLLVEEEFGGQGASALELGAALLEAGRAGHGGPLLSVAGVAVRLLQGVDPTDRHGLRARIATEGLRVVPAATETRDTFEVLTTAVSADADGRLSGVKSFVDGGASASHLLVNALGPDEQLGLYLVEVGSPGVQVRVLDAVDLSRGVAEVSLDGAPGALLASGATVGAALTDAWQLGAVLNAADSLGAATRVMELSGDYAHTRTQFGRTIGSFQAVKHMIVDMYAELETAGSAVRAALRDQAAGDRDCAFSASAAAARAGDATMQVARQGIQVHGGIGFTWEHEMSHHFRRVAAARQMYGTPVQHRARVASIVGL